MATYGTKNKKTGKSYTYGDVRITGIKPAYIKQLENIKSHLGGSYGSLLMPCIIDFINSKPEWMRKTKSPD